MENNKQQTAVGWYIIKRDEIEMKIRLKLICANEYEQELIKADEQAKEMEKHQIMDARRNGSYKATEKYGERRTNIQYYNETFKQQ